jgi:hypothetical protein
LTQLAEACEPGSPLVQAELALGRLAANGAAFRATGDPGSLEGARSALQSTNEWLAAAGPPWSFSPARLHHRKVELAAALLPAVVQTGANPAARPEIWLPPPNCLTARAALHTAVFYLRMADSGQARHYLDEALTLSLRDRSDLVTILAGNLARDCFDAKRSGRLADRLLWRFHTRRVAIRRALEPDNADPPPPLGYPAIGAWLDWVARDPLPVWAYHPA